ncbi:protein-tyrosine phosphatase family protein [Ramlibacter sp.]|uniref:protein-tyrosine phosphatase family protein n=1 Tax=Ramlibacter sp. TaxID=1917967 RepID=UPI002B77B16F|nr:tyrosine-protein phosphatase [Ramlibacter sp.]HWI83902.1 tyrosine-protein phosphatase [Ramlibacter sp.]
MEFRLVDLPPPVTGSLLLAGMPARFEPWPAFEARARTATLQLVVCLTPRTEIEELSPAYYQALVQDRLPFRWLNLPMRNFGLPEDTPAFRQGVHQIAAALRGGDAVMLHCAAGLGRTGSTAACVLKALGLDAEDALQRVRDAGSNPQNAQQSGLVNWF